MPYENRWVSAPRNPELPVLSDAELPEGHTTGKKEDRWRAATHVSGSAHGRRDFYYCNRECQGWIEGHPRTYQENTLAPLAGRKGHADYCIRCGQEVAFMGVIS